ncbi:MAG: BNR-4 repeat-containing protein, partial [Gammaproteobacteria bacterium]|nr:BNR-4 repeat-containing protein [Gammaproteobacteria bacterium]
MINHPHAAYYNGKTYIAWQGANLDPYITYYDHTIKSWRASTRVADNPLVADSHGTPSIVIDNSGYIHVFYGSHGTNQKHAKSNNPENIGGFTVQTDLVGSYTYPQPIKVRNSIYLFNRAPYVTGESYRIYNGASWGEMNTIITSPTVAGTRTYAGYMELNNNKIHITWVYDYGLDRRNVFYAYLNLADHHMYTINGIDLGTTIDSTEAETYAIVRNTGTNNSNPPFLHIDSNGYPWIFYIEGSGTSFKYFHTRWTGSAWTSPVAITTTDDQYNYLDFIINSVSDVTAYLTSAGGTGLGGDIEKWHWDGFTWSKDQTVLTQSASGKPLNCPVVPFNFNPELEVLFSQYLDENFADTTLKLYAYVGKSAPDAALPQVFSTDPANNENNVPAAKTITVNFNENIQAGANYSSISLKDSNNNPVSISTTESGNALTIDPASALSFNTTYTTTIPVGAVKDMSNNLLESSYSFSFTTSTQPILTSIIIIPYSATVARGTTLTFTASPNDQFGNPFTAQVNWASSNTFVGTINTKGVFTA